MDLSTKMSLYEAGTGHSRSVDSGSDHDSVAFLSASGTSANFHKPSKLMRSLNEERCGLRLIKGCPTSRRLPRLSCPRATGARSGRTVVKSQGMDIVAMVARSPPGVSSLLSSYYLYLTSAFTLRLQRSSLTELLRIGDCFTCLGRGSQGFDWNITPVMLQHLIYRKAGKTRIDSRSPKW